MKEIKRYTIQTLRIRGQEPYTTMGISSDGDFVLITDHKAVLEAMQKENKSLIAEKEVLDIVIADKTKEYNAKLEINMEMQKRIDKLEANKYIKEVEK